MAKFQIGQKVRLKRAQLARKMENIDVEVELPAGTEGTITRTQDMYEVANKVLGPIGAMLLGYERGTTGYGIDDYGASLAEDALEIVNE